MYCPNCGQEYKWFETTCPSCGVALVAERPGGAPDPDVELESVFETVDPAVLPLATMTLDQQGIEYTVRGTGSLDALRYPPDVLDLSRSDATHELVVRKDDAARAREVLADLIDLASPPPGFDALGRVLVFEPAGTDPAPPAQVPTTPPSTVVDLATGAQLGSITPQQAQFLIDALEESSPEEARYYIDAATIEMLETSGGDPEVITLLRNALGGRDGMEIRF